MAGVERGRSFGNSAGGSAWALAAGMAVLLLVVAPAAIYLAMGRE